MKISLFAYFLISVLLVSCEGDYDIYYNFTDLTVEHAQNLEEEPQVNTLDSIPKEAYVLRLNLFPVEISREGRYLDKETPPRNTNPIHSILVIADQAFDASHGPGTSLNDFFVIYNYNYSETMPLSDCGQISKLDTHEFYDSPLPEKADLLLLLPPETAQEYQFTVKLILADDTEWTATTDPILIY